MILEEDFRSQDDADNNHNEDNQYFGQTVLLGLLLQKNPIP